LALDRIGLLRALVASPAASPAMKLFGAACAALLVGAAGAASTVQRSAEAGRTITQVVKLLQSMLDKSKADGDTERTLYAKYKCYCDTSSADKKAEIEKLTEEIALLESKIDELQSSTGGLSQEVAKLDKDIAANKQAQEEATAIRKRENEDFLALEKDLTDAIGQMKRAIKTLAEVGADQTLASAADHKQYMAGHEGAALVEVKNTLRQALLAANAFVSPKQAVVVDAFLQAPFTGTYTAQSGEVVGILKNMLDTFEANLAAATKTEAEQLAAHEKYMAELEEALKAMQASYNKKQGELGGNDGDLATKRGQLDVAVAAKAEAEDFLAKLIEMCAAKKKQYEERVQLRTNEQAALAEAISILNSDAAFATFGTVDATKTGATALLQTAGGRRAAVRHHRSANFAVSEDAPSFEAVPRRAMSEFLQRAAKAHGGSTALGRVVDLLRANNPFSTVLAEIEKMISLLAAEGAKDKKQHDWCTDERQKTDQSILDTEAEITNLDVDIQKLDLDIEDPQTGLKANIKQEEDLLQENYQGQVTQTEERHTENVAYQKDISNLAEASTLLQRAISVLRKYYSKISDQIKAEADVAFVQSKKGKRDDPAPPATWDDKYKGQSEAGGTDAVSMLEYILKTTKVEENVAHDDELKAQTDYEDSMQALKTEEANLQAQLAENRKLLADKEQELLEKKKDLKATEADKKALEEYLVEIKPGCDFITTNLDLRNTNRANEKAALENAVSLIKGTPAYTEAMDAAHQESLGDCRDICAEGEAHVNCKACLAKTSVPGYCAGHAGTVGC